MTGAAQQHVPAAVERARRIVLAHGWNSTSYQLVNPGLRLWFDEDAVTGYGVAAGRMVVAGAPVCAPERLGTVARHFQDFAAGAGRKVCYFGAGSRLERELAGCDPRSRVLLGSQPVWDPSHWSSVAARHASIRAQLNRARNKGVSVAEWAAREAQDSAQLRRILERWLGTRGLPPMGFLVEPDTLGRVLDRRAFVATREDTPVAFLLASPVPARNGWLVEQIVRDPGAPNGTNELLVDAAMTALAADGSRYVTLGLSPLSSRAPAPASSLPAWLRLTFAWVRAHGRRFFNFEGLDAFKSKLRPDEWEPVYVLTPGRPFSPLDLYAIAGVFGRGSAAGFIGRALWRAASEEFEAMRARG
jgi:phosphatidylglycerol lysyltransferase